MARDPLAGSTAGGSQSIFAHTHTHPKQMRISSPMWAMALMMKTKVRPIMAKPVLLVLHQDQVGWLKSEETGRWIVKGKEKTSYRCCRPITASYLYLTVPS